MARMRTYWSTWQRFEVRIMWCHPHKLGVAEWLQREGRWSGLKLLIGARIYRATTSNWVSHKPVGTVIKTHNESQPGTRIYKQWKDGATIQDVTKSICEYIKTPAQDELLKKASGSWTGRGTIMDDQAPAWTYPQQIEEGADIKKLKLEEHTRHPRGQEGDVILYIY